MGDRIMETTHENSKKKQQIFKNMSSLMDLCDNIKDTNILIIGVPEEEGRMGSKCI